MISRFTAAAAGILLAGALATAIVPQQASAQVQRADVSSYIGYDTFRSAALSPNGRYIAGILRDAEGDLLIIHDRTTKETKAIQRAREDQSLILSSIWFKNDERLIFSLQQKYEIVAGERRWLAAQKAGLNEVPVVVLDIDDQKSLEIAIVENVQRQDLNAIEEAKGYQRLIKEFGYDHEKISKFMSKSRSHISNTLRLLTLPQDIISMIEEGLLSAGQARPLIGLPNSSTIAENIVKKKFSAREVESLIKQKKTSKKSKKTEDPNITFVQNEIESKLGMNVQIINKKNNSGKLIINYSSLDQFELLSKKLRK